MIWDNSYVNIVSYQAKQQCGFNVVIGILGERCGNNNMQSTSQLPPMPTELNSSEENIWIQFKLWPAAKQISKVAKGSLCFIAGI